MVKVDQQKNLLISRDKFLFFPDLYLKQLLNFFSSPIFVSVGF